MQYTIVRCFVRNTMPCVDSLPEAEIMHVQMSLIEVIKILKSCILLIITHSSSGVLVPRSVSAQGSGAGLWCSEAVLCAGLDQSWLPLEEAAALASDGAAVKPAAVVRPSVPHRQTPGPAPAAAQRRRDLSRAADGGGVCVNTERCAVAS